MAWQWCARESTAAWTALLNQVPAPGVIVSDGGSGLPSALKACWPETKHQHCLFHLHLQMNISRHLTRNTRTDAGKALRGLVMQLSDITDEDAAIAWRIHLDQWWQAFGRLTKERTPFRSGQFGYTHDRLRKAWSLINTVTRCEALFICIAYGNPRTTSPLEGGINAPIRDLLRRHRGMTEEHRKQAAEWFLTLHEFPLEHALTLATRERPSAPTPDGQDGDDTPEPIHSFWPITLTL
ncbi:transposase [Plantibacter sp. Mn2098]|uniref:transposase n=1 Tax=Plantibacter sp. Mn2098 TaxID=3395266 RepID=UPI003BD2A2BF